MPLQRIVSKGRLPFYYLLIELEFESDPPELTLSQFKAILLHAFALMFGELGQASAQIDLIQYRPSKMEACLRIDDDSLVKLWGALTLFSEYGGKKCVFRVNQVSGNLLGLAVNSREFVHQQHGPRDNVIIS